LQKKRERALAVPLRVALVLVLLSRVLASPQPIGTSSVFKNSRSAHRAIVPIAVVPLLLTAVTGILYSLLEVLDIELDWLIALHIGKLGPLDLEPFYSVILGACVLVLAGSGLSLWFKNRRRAA
jgi:hypothetical protein